MTFARTTTTRLILGLSLVACLFTGCAESPTPRYSHAPTYSYLRDPAALAEIDLWPAVPGQDQSLIAANNSD